jgi:TPR repeat protein
MRILWGVALASVVLPISVAVPAHTADRAGAGRSAELSKLEREALLGDAKAAYQLLGKTALAGGGTSDSSYWLEVAAENGHPIAQYNLGAKLLGSVDPRDQVRSEYWLSRAAQSGDRSAAELLKQIRKGTLRTTPATKQ